jgi:DNA-binding response OmpR family regulator
LVCYDKDIDDVHLTNVLKAHFQALGFEVRVALKGSEGLAAALKQAPDVILLDVVLPDMTGFQMCNQLREADATKTVPISAMGAFANQQHFAFERGANEYVRKPVEVEELGKLVHAYAGSLPAPRMPEKLPLPQISSKKEENPKSEISQADTGALRAFLKDALQHQKKPLI